VRVDSAPGEGSTFTVEVPRRQGASATGRTVRAAETPVDPKVSA
jgi:hypothetical protein